MHLSVLSDTLAVYTSTFPRDLSMDLGITRAPAVMVRPAGWAFLELSELYIILITRWAEDERLEAIQKPLNFVILLLDLHVNRFQALAAKHYTDFLEIRDSVFGASAFEPCWKPLRDAIELATFAFDAFKQYDSCHANGANQRSSRLQKLTKRFDAVMRKAAQMEQHMRDELHLRVGHSSLQESKESIKQSKIAIEESKRVKMRTWPVPDED
jgi:tryptophan 2,3-dioxygenase